MRIVRLLSRQPQQLAPPPPSFPPMGGAAGAWNSRVHPRFLQLPSSLRGEQVHQALLQEKRAREDDSERLLAVFESTVRDSYLSNTRPCSSCSSSFGSGVTSIASTWAVSCMIKCLLLVLSLQVSEIEQQQRILRQEQETSEMELLIAVRELSLLRRSTAASSQNAGQV